MGGDGRLANGFRRITIHDRCTNNSLHSFSAGWHNATTHSGQRVHGNAINAISDWVIDGVRAIPPRGYHIGRYDEDHHHHNHLLYSLA